MSFQHSAYQFSCLILPLIIILVFALWLCVCIIRLIMKSHRGKTVSRDMTSCLIVLLIAAFVSVPQIKSLSSGGIHLITEKEQDAIVDIITIDSICEPSERFPNYKHNHNFGADVASGDRLYFVESCSEFSPGDTVSISYLPRSGIILDIRELP